MLNQSAIPKPTNEPIKDYTPGSAEKENLLKKYQELKSQEIEIPLIIGGKEIRSRNIGKCVIPHDHKYVLATFHQAGENEVQMAINATQNAWKAWSKKPLSERSEIFLRAADLLAGPWRDTVNAATMLNMSKNVFQAEIDSACELIDFFRFNPWYAQELATHQPMYSPESTKNSVELRPLEGFIFAVSPFNFASIAGNLPCAPALMGNTVLWKPASSAVYPAYFIIQLLHEAGLPAGVINFIPGNGSQVGPQVMNSPLLAGIHFTGSTKVFQNMWKEVGKNIQHYHSYPRIVGETGGKNFCIAHESTDIDALVTAMIRGAFEYQGQKCSALSRAYIPTTIWEKVKSKYLTELNTVKMGDPDDFTNFINAVIDRSAYTSITEYIDYAQSANDADIISGGGYDDSKGYFIEPTTILTDNPHFRTMCEEIFGPILTIYLYAPTDWEDTLTLVDSTSAYALTGCVLAKDKDAIVQAKNALPHSAGNFYINDKPTGAVVGQQPFGGSRASGTNDKAGSMFNLARWVSQRTIKENFDPPRDYRYPFMAED